MNPSALKILGALKNLPQHLTKNLLLMEEAEADEYLEDQFEQLFESFSNLKEEQEKLKKELKIQSCLLQEMKNQTKA